MKSKSLRLICVGKLKTKCWKDACAHYLHLIHNWRLIECIEVKDGNTKLDAEQRTLEEGKNILAHISEKDHLFALSEDGMNMTSGQFAAFLRNNDEHARRRLNFIIGGPFGLSATVLSRCTGKLSLSAMTWPHELARVLLLEQLFRAECIIRKFPYHH